MKVNNAITTSVIRVGDQKGKTPLSIALAASFGTYKLNPLAAKPSIIVIIVKIL